MRLRFVTGALFILLLCPAGRAAQQLDQAFETDYGFTVRLPDEWKEVPADVLKPLNQKMSEASHIPQHWEYAYQIKNSNRWLAYPYILVQFYPGRRSEASFKSDFEAKTQMQDELEEASKKASAVLSDPKVGTYYYDAAARTVEFVTEMDLSGIGKMEGYTALKLTENGVIEFCGYCTADSKAESIPFFRSVANGIQLSAASVYQPGILDNVPFLGSINWSGDLPGIIGGAFGAILVLFVLRSRKKPDPTE